MTLVALGIQRYRLKTGRLPSQLSDLVSAYLAAMPRDFINGKDLVYRLRLQGDDFLLYSVGEDGKDEAATPPNRRGTCAYCCRTCTAHLIHIGFGLTSHCLPGLKAEDD